jgi:hypothetical protein
MSSNDPARTRLPKCDLTEKTFALMREKRITFAEARRELGRRGAAARAAKNLRVKNHGALLRKMGLS